MSSHAHIVNSGVKSLEEIGANIRKFASANLKIKVKFHNLHFCHKVYMSLQHTSILCIFTYTYRMQWEVPQLDLDCIS